MNPPLNGTTVFGYANGTSSNSFPGLSSPWGITVNTDNSTLITNQNPTGLYVVFANGTSTLIPSSAGWMYTRRAYFSSSLSNLFIIDGYNCRMLRYSNGLLTETVLFGTCGVNLTQFGDSASFCRDSMSNFYVADTSNNRIMFWPANATNTTKGDVLAGVTSVSGNDTQHLNSPQDITLDETRGFFYVADNLNDRILQYPWNSTSGTIVAGGNGTVVAGGNGRGMAPK